jgi:hypothetical protein
MPGLLNEISKVVSMIGGAGIAADSTGSRYDGYTAADSTNYPIDTRYYDQAYVTVQTGANAAGFTAGVRLSPSTDPLDAAAVTIGSFGTLSNSTMYTGFVLTKGYPRYMWLQTDGTAPAHSGVAITASVVLYNYDRPTDQTSTDTFAVIA